MNIYRVQVGRIALFLLNTNLPENAPHDREITAQLYGGDQDMRFRQEILLGVGGVHALETLGLEPTVFHMNEGHSAFSGLERMRRLMKRGGLSLEAAKEVVKSNSVFTTHTPVPAERLLPARPGGQVLWEVRGRPRVVLQRMPGPGEG